MKHPRQKASIKKLIILGRGSGQCARLLVRRSEFKPADIYSIFCKKIVFEKNKNKQKEAGVGPFKS